MTSNFAYEMAVDRARSLECEAEQQREMRISQREDSTSVRFLSAGRQAMRVLRAVLLILGL